MLSFYKDVGGYWRWRIVASNGVIVGASSEGFSSESYCKENAVKVANAIILYFKK